jgi:hypothetical protein
VSEFIDPVFAKTGLKCSFSVIENERFGLVFAKTGSINSGTDLFESISIYLLLLLTIIFFTFYNAGYVIG